MALPALTPQQRADALEKAAAARAHRAQFKAELKSGALILSAFLEKADSDEALGKTRVVSLLESLPGIGEARARRIMDEVGISDSRRVRGLGPHQRAALIERFG